MYRDRQELHTQLHTCTHASATLPPHTKMSPFLKYHSNEYGLTLAANGSVSRELIFLRVGCGYGLSVCLHRMGVASKTCFLANSLNSGKLLGCFFFLNSVHIWSVSCINGCATSLVRNEIVTAAVCIPCMDNGINIVHCCSS